MELRLELAKAGIVFLERQDDGISVMASGWEVRRLSSRFYRLGVDRVPAIAHVSAVVPMIPPPSSVIDINSAEFSSGADGSVSTLEMIIGVDKMPSDYVVSFDDGSVWLVESNEWSGISDTLKKRSFQMRVLRDLFRRWWSDAPFDATFVLMDSDSARHLFWILQPGFSVIN